MATQTVILTTSVAPYGGAVTQVLVRSQAVTGPTGPQGPQGPTGPQGPQGSPAPVQAISGTATVDVSSINQDAATPIAGLSWSATSGVMYHFKARGVFQTAATTTGLRLGFSTTVATTICSWGVSIQQGAGVTQMMFTNFANALTSTITSASVVAANTDYVWEIEGYVKPSANGTIAIGFGTEVAASQALIRPGSVLIVTTCT